MGRGGVQGGVQGGVGWGAKFLFVFDVGIMLYLFFDVSVLCLVLISTISIESPALSPQTKKYQTYRSPTHRFSQYVFEFG